MAFKLRVAGVVNRFAIFRAPGKIKASLASEVDGVFITPGMGRRPNVTRITDSDSPYTILITDDIILCDTDSGAVTANLPAGTDEERHTVKNTGSAGNNVTLAPDGTEDLEGENANETIGDAESFQVIYETMEGWRII
jgi:hypothetical protein